MSDITNDILVQLSEKYLVSFTEDVGHSTAAVTDHINVHHSTEI